MITFSHRFCGLIFCLGIALSAGGCFTVREPETASPATLNSNRLSPVQPDILIQNFIQSVTSLNTGNYERCFNRDLFLFIPDPTVAQNNQGLFARWGFIEEIEYFKNLQEQSVQTENNTLVFEQIQRNFINPDSVEYQADYKLEVFHQDAGFNFFIFEGNIRFVMRRNADNEWEITAWRDNKTGTNPCWTELKEHFFIR